MNLVPTTKTPLTAQQAIDAFHAACLAVLGSISAEALAIAIAQSALETGRWKSLYCFNFGNEKATAAWSGDYYMIRCNEIIGGKLQWFDPPHPQTWFRAFPDAATGARSHVEFLAQNKRYAEAWAAALAGDPAAYAHALKVHGYYTASEALYLRGIVSLFNEFLPVVKASPAPEPVPDHSATSDADLAALAPLLELPDWLPDVESGVQADELAQDIHDATTDAAVASGPVDKG